MPVCYICKTSFPTVKLLILHFRVVHYFSKISNYKCSEKKNCTRTFLALNSYKRHLNTHMKCENSKGSLKYCTGNNTSELVSVNNSSVLSNSTIVNDYQAVEGTSKNRGNIFTLGGGSSSNNFEFSVHNSGILSNSSCENINKNIEETSENTENIFTLAADSSHNFELNGIFLSDFRKQIFNQISRFICKFYEKNNCPRSIVQEVISHFEECLLLPLHIIKNQISVASFQNLDTKTNLIEMCDLLGNMFSNLHSEHRRFKFLEQTGKFIKPLEITVGQQMQLSSNGIMEPKALTFQFIPLRHTLKHFLELKNVYLECADYLKKLNTESDSYLTNFVQGDLWKEKVKANENNIFPLFIYFDEFEIGNALGTHAGIHKLGGVYCSLPILPLKYHSELKNIFVCMLFHSMDLKQFGSKVLFSQLVNELNFLESHGIEIFVDNKPFNVKFKLVLLQGDNLGLNTILGFTQCFRSNYFCRFCKKNKNDMAKQVEVDQSVLRTKYNYEVDLLLNDVSLTGIKEPCVFNRVNSFHVTENYVFDIMHDLLEGVCNYDMSHILYQFIIIDKVITLESFNAKIQYFDYGFELKNKPPPLKNDDIKNKRIHMSASEMLCFCRYFGIIIGNVIPQNNKYWQFFLLLREIISIVTSFKINKYHIGYLKQLIKRHHTAYLSLFPNCSLSPKHHFMIHWPEIILKSGPPVLLWSMRYESKHKELKSSANVIASRVNISKSLAIKTQLKLCNRFLLNEGFDIELSSSSSFTYATLEDLVDFDEYEKNLLRQKSFTYSLTKVSSVSIFGTIYKEKNVILVSMENDLPQFGIIKRILINTEKNIFFIYKKIKTHKFYKHFYAFEVECPTRDENSNIVAHDDLSYINPVLLSLINNKCYATLRYLM